MIGIDSLAEINSTECITGPQTFSDAELAAHAASNDAQLDRLIALANEYTDEIVAVSVGNENRFPFVGHLVSEERLVEHTKKLHAAVKQPVAFCEVDIDWKNLDAIANAVDIIGIHTYPYHMDVAIEDAFAETKESFESACAIYPDKQICFTGRSALRSLAGQQGRRMMIMPIMRLLQIRSAIWRKLPTI